jgi:hypothetical protein
MNGMQICTSITATPRSKNAKHTAVVEIHGRSNVA